MAFPNLLEVMTNVVVLVVGLPLIYLLSRILRVRSKPITIAVPKKEIILACLVIVAEFSILFVVRTWSHLSQSDLRPANDIDLVGVAGSLIVYVPALLVVALAMKRSRQSLESIGITGKDGGRMLALGLAASAIYITLVGLLNPSFGGVFAGFSPALFYGFILFTIGSASARK